MKDHMTVFKKLTGLAACAFLCALFIASAPSWADNQKRLQVGDMIPPIEAIDQYGSYQTLETLSGDEGLILVFLRSVDWCSYCRNQIFDLAAYKERFNDAGYNLAGLSYDSPLITMSFSNKYTPGFILLSDQESEIIKNFGILNRSYPETSDYFGIPHPAIYIINPDGEITGYFAEEGYKKRPNLEEVLAAITGSKTDTGKKESRDSRTKEDYQKYNPQKNSRRSNQIKYRD